ncbi:amidase family protein [Microbacterium sp. F51-2R]|uniref:amidase family protein n=1 Tax=Microbacterium sp. F51-2R TaxID=3445777 RepID=UPI003FA07C6F
MDHDFDEACPAVPGPLGGAPLGVKDIIDLRDHPTRCGSALRADAPPASADAPIVRSWRAAGAVPLGKTVTTEFAFFSPGPTRNPVAPAHTPGGSSSGSAAAVAAGQVPLAIASQTAGSVTRPASYCGVAALVMSRGRFPVDGVVGLAESFDSHGVYAARTRDVELAWSALTRQTTVETTAPPRVLLWLAEGVGELDDEMAAGLERAASSLRAHGAQVEPFPEVALSVDLTTSHPRVMAYEAARERADELARADRLSEPLTALLRTGAAMSRSEYTEARDVLRRGAQRMSQLLATGAVIVGPAALGAAPAGLASTGDPVLSRAWQALGLPQVTVPGLRNEQGLPLGIQVIGAHGREAELLSAAHWVEDGLGED